MNLNVTSYNRIRRRKNRFDGEKKNQIFLTALKFSIPFCLLFSTAVARVLITSKTDKLNKRAVKIEKELRDIQREIDNLAVKKERLCGIHVKAQIARFNLNLKYPRPGQLQKLETVMKKDSFIGPGKEPIMLTQRNNTGAAGTLAYYGDRISR